MRAGVLVRDWGGPGVESCAPPFQMLVVQRVVADTNRRTGESECQYYKERLLYAEEGQRDELIDLSKTLSCHGELKNNRGLVSRSHLALSSFSSPSACLGAGENQKGSRSSRSSRLSPCPCRSSTCFSSRTSWSSPGPSRSTISRSATSCAASPSQSGSWSWRTL